MAYLSACHAGCHVVDVTHIDGMTESVKNYSNCACLGLSSPLADGWSVVEGKCSRECNTFIPFVLLLFLVVFLICCAQNPALIITLKSVSSSSERSFALGMQYFLLRAVAFIPAPIYFGYLFDTQCILWQPSCENGKQGACWEYSIENLPYTMFGMACGLRILGFIFILLTYLSIKRDGRRKGCMQLANGGKDLDPNKMVHSVSTVSCDTMTSSVSSDNGVKPVRLETYI
ncbi:solute carrier organic anion transporter family member 5A1 [Lingula anatina]|uniref:Solute carrier organic anion transporter family member 5A1 n=1 Tax=Lingula anatina TaxID=7574 RepID=A0A1S3I2M9_LINAN|nr:solute carrier organic anion transporter family member 5A1 [Lingula anatina]|eukprot:XP_013392081.1 solute carrier organic anion transporter family member 5A1 [Lingula anatina]